MAFQFTDDNFKEQVSSDKVSVVDFWAEWCGPCRMIAPIIDQLSEEMGDKVIVGKLNVDHNPQTAVEYGVRNIPTILIMKNGKVVKKQVGTTTKSKLVQMIEEAQVA